VAEVGWWDFECPGCGWYTGCDLVELIVEGDLEGFCAGTETSEQVKNLIRAVMKRCPAVIAEIRSELDAEKKH